MLSLFLMKSVENGEAGGLKKEFLIASRHIILCASRRYQKIGINKQ